MVQIAGFSSSSRSSILLLHRCHVRAFGSAFAIPLILAARRRDHERRRTGRPSTSAPLVAGIAWHAHSGRPSWPYQTVSCCSSSAQVRKELPNYRGRVGCLPEVGPPLRCFVEHKFCPAKCAPSTERVDLGGSLGCLRGFQVFQMQLTVTQHGVSPRELRIFVDCFLKQFGALLGVAVDFLHAFFKMLARLFRNS